MYHRSAHYYYLPALVQQNGTPAEMELIRPFSVVLGLVLDAQLRIHAHESAA
jgi:hypothetical protein